MVANTVRASLVRGSEAASDSQFSMSAAGNAPEGDKGTTSAPEMESEFIERRIFSSRTSWNGWGAVGSLEGEAPMTCQAVYGGSRKRVKEKPPVRQQFWALISDISWGSTLRETHVMRDKGARSGQSTHSHLEPQVGVDPYATVVANWPVVWDPEVMRQCRALPLRSSTL